MMHYAAMNDYHNLICEFVTNLPSQRELSTFNNHYDNTTFNHDNTYYHHDNTYYHQVIWYERGGVTLTLDGREMTV